MVLLSAAAGLVSVLYAVLAFRRRGQTPLALPLALIIAGVAEWSLAQALSLATTTELARAFNYAVFPGVAAVVIGHFWYATVSSGRRPPRFALLLVHPVLLLIAIATDPWTHVFYRSVESAADYGLVVHPGPAYWLHTVYSYSLLAAGVVLVIRAMRRAVRAQRRLYLYFLAGGFAPVLGNLVTIFADVDAQRFDLTPMLFLVTALVWWWAERTGMNAERVPVAYKQVIAAIGDAVMVLDPGGRFLDVNPAATDLLATVDPAGGGAVVGRQWKDVAGPYFAGLLADTRQCTVTGPLGNVYDLRVARMRDKAESTAGTVVVVRDITELERLRAELTDHAVRDGLTGVFNRRHLTTVLDAQVQRATAAGEPLAVVLIDVDHFKSVNDRYGHAVGDQVLIDLARGLAGAARRTDTVARYGGEEFVVIMPGTDARAAADFAEQWRRRCAAACTYTPQGPLQVTFSAGVAQLPAGSRHEDLLRLADEALYEAKRAGRNRIVMADQRLSAVR
ncbi:diguanylate cyclase [Actinoplanes sp. NPDC026623]|uniref:histidine kinase N-terminal 7TM domain-containing diguanylate cyclase n=1 Tax=Actinoplanes sp. NPDC026623 TaxID=3155610 RepID=UPI0033DFA02F